jgi:hypothetical protein
MKNISAENEILSRELLRNQGLYRDMADEFIQILEDKKRHCGDYLTPSESLHKRINGIIQKQAKYGKKQNQQILKTSTVPLHLPKPVNPLNASFGIQFLFFCYYIWILIMYLLYDVYLCY